MLKLCLQYYYYVKEADVKVILEVFLDVTADSCLEFSQEVMHQVSEECFEGNEGRKKKTKESLGLDYRAGDGRGNSHPFHASRRPWSPLHPPCNDGIWRLLGADVIAAWRISNWTCI